MNKNGIDSKKTNKRDACSFLLFVFLLPYVCACLWGHVGEETGKLKKDTTGGQAAYTVEAVVEWGVWELPAEEYLAYRLLTTMPEDYHLEAKKAQAVLLRTELAALYQEAGSRRITVTGEGFAKYYKDTDGETREALRESRQAVEETKGVILTWRGKPIRASYFKLSNGFTREAVESGEEECPYLAKTSCGEDRTSPDYHSVVRVEREAYIDALQGILQEDFERETLWESGELSYDESGYVTKVSYYDGNGKTEEVDGETFRHLFGLNSAAFEVKREDGDIFFQVAGVGHGFGMSQYAADCRAKNGQTYEDILESFFFETELAKFE